MAEKLTKTTGLGKTVNLTALKKLAARIDTAKTKLDDARITNAELYSEAEQQGFNRPALKMALKLRSMEVAKRNDFLDSLQAYCEALGVWAQGDMLGDQPGVPQPPAEGDAEAEMAPPPGGTAAGAEVAATIN